MIHRNLLTGLLIFMCWNTGFAQYANLCEKTTQKSYTILYEHEDSRSFHKNILETYAASVPKPPEKMQVKLNYDQDIIVERSGKKLHFQILIRNLKTNENFSYKGFDISKSLLPDRIDFNVLWMDNNENLIRNFPFESVELKNAVKRIADFKATDTTLNKDYRFEIKNEFFYYDRKAKQNFEKKINTIDNYYSYAVFFKEANQKLEEIDTDEVEKLEDYKKTIDGIQQQLELIEKEKLEEMLPLRENDPVKFRKNLILTSKNNDRIKRTVEYMLENMHEAYYKKGMQLIKKENQTEAGKYFNKSLEIDPGYAPPFFQLAEIKFNKGLTEEALEDVQTIIADFDHSDHTYKNCVNLLQKIISRFIENAQKNIENQKYDEAVNLLEKSEKICLFI